MKKLDILQNPTLNQEFNHCLLNQKTQNLPPILQEGFKKNQNDLRELSGYFGGESGGNFGFSSGAFIELFSCFQSFKIAFALSNHQQAYQAYQSTFNLFDFKPILPNVHNKIIEDLQDFKDCEVFIIPYINQDILTINPIEQLYKQILSFNPNALLIVDISYALRFGEKPQLQKNMIFLCDGESLGFLRGYGIYLCHSHLTHLFPPIRYIDGFYSAFLQAIITYSTPPKDYKLKVYQLLQSLLNHHISLFAPLSSCFTNSLPLRFQNIKARLLLQSLYLDKIDAINGQACLFGFNSPSFVLKEMGYSDLESRELLSISFEGFDLQIFEALAKHYLQIQALEV